MQYEYFILDLSDPLHVCPSWVCNTSLLEAAYKNTMERARENELKSVGFCILSAGIFRGGCPLKVVIKTGLETIAKNTYPGLETVVFCGFTLAGAGRALTISRPPLRRREMMEREEGGVCLVRGNSLLNLTWMTQKRFGAPRSPVGWRTVGLTPRSERYKRR